MADIAKFGLLRKVLRAIGLSDAAINDLLDWITDRLVDEQQGTDGEAAPQIFPYHICDDFLSPAERSFYQVLNSVAGTRFLICPKVRTADLFFVKSSDPRERQVYRNKIDRKHVDFVLCDPDTLIPLAGIELDDKSHESAKSKQRDRFVEGVFAAAGLKLLRVRTQRGYQVRGLAAMLESLLPSESDETQLTPPPFRTTHRNTPSDSSPANGHHSTEEESLVIPSPQCPKCGSEMILRTAKKGSNQGQQFWGCSNFPRCRAIIPYERVAV